MANTTVIVETPGRTAAKYAYDPESKAFVLKRLLPVGMILPYDFGFVPGTCAEDGDPLDAMVLSEVQTFPGCHIDCRVIGAVTATQTEPQEAKPFRNDFLLVVPQESVLWTEVNELSQLPQAFVDQLERFFQGYHAMQREVFVPLERLNAAAAAGLIERTRRALKQSA
ncbi:MAG TPA: inorganic diphosphatase [Polyangiaceae bacterium]|nr:inorganic diphosphatase [Polyangiaceae bacterium]